MTDLFSRTSQFYEKISSVIGDLKTKSKFILKQKGIVINEKNKTLTRDKSIDTLNSPPDHFEDKDLGLLRLF